MVISGLTTRLQEKFQGSILDVSEYNGEISINVKGLAILEILSFLKTDGFNFLVDLTAVDNLTLGGYDRFAVVYHLLSHENVERIVVKAYIHEEKPSLPSVESLWKTANWQEREVYDLYG
ncbi:MAG: NADH-quinone oxidoreductase subunit C, partial [Candidatus Marinimicrobia bacterium]|nr:NADH-quinone oxidoreductase subunit C [Candidatus Neomarinimicrobiota bacterium]